jgi:hypothetical protein
VARVLAACGGPEEAIISEWMELTRAEQDRQRAAELALISEEERRSVFLSAVVWPEASAEAPWQAFHPLRESDAPVQPFWSEKMGRHITCDSKLEDHLARRLESATFIRAYCEQPVRIRYHWFDGDHWYYPDFAVCLDDGRCVLIEVKPRSNWADGANLAKWNAATRWCSEQGWGFAVLDQGRYPQTQLKMASPKAGKLLRKLTSQGEASASQLMALWFGSGHTYSSLVANCLAHGFAILRAPLRVRPARNSPWLLEIARSGTA